MARRAKVDCKQVLRDELAKLNLPATSTYGEIVHRHPHMIPFFENARRQTREYMRSPEYVRHCEELARRQSEERGW